MNNLNLVVGGDLNFSIVLSETWGLATQADPLANFFFEQHSLSKYFRCQFDKIHNHLEEQESGGVQGS